ncbi:MAG: transaldolase family protein [bacterium]|nr:transaldolase family protein [bacterium]
MNHNGRKTKIFLDSGDPTETRQIKEILGFLDGQTTNPTLVARNPEVQERLKRGEKFSDNEIFKFYKNVVQEVSSLIPHGSVSVEVYADADTSTEEMFLHGRGMSLWIPNAHIKYPTTKQGLLAAEMSVGEGMRVNMTLVFTQEQAAAVYAATRVAKHGDVFVSPFVGRLDDRGENGMDLVKNILQMYSHGDKHVEVLTASVRTLDHLLYAIALGSDIVSAPFAILKEWAEKGTHTPGHEYAYDKDDLVNIPYDAISLEKPWATYKIHHELTDKGIERFSADWNNLVT